MTAVWDGFPGAGSELLCLLAMADFANEDGSSVHPSIATVARKIRTSESQARRLIRGLEEQGYLTVVGNAGGGAPGSTRHYKVAAARLYRLAHEAYVAKTGGMGATPGVDATPSTGARDGSHGCAGGVAPVRETGGVGATRPTIEPSLNHQENRQTSNPHPQAADESVGSPELAAAFKALLPTDPPAPVKVKAEEVPEGFLAFWKAYPSVRRVDRKACLAKWVKLGLEARAEAILANVQGWCQSEAWQKEGGQFAPMSTTYINQSRWETPPPAPGGSSKDAQSKAFSDSIKAMANGGSVPRSKATYDGEVIDAEVIMPRRAMLPHHGGPL